MKTAHLFLTFLTIAAVASCSQFNTNAQAKNAKMKAKLKKESPIDLNAKSAPMNGYNYYNTNPRVPDAAPKMEKQKAAKNVKPGKKATTKK